MAFTLPTLQETRQQVATDIETYLPGPDTRTRRTVAGVLAQAIAGAIRGLHANIEYREKNFLPDERAEAEGVERWAALLGKWYLDATGASGEAILTGASGATLPAGTLMQYTDGTEYATTSEATLVGVSGTVAIEAVEAGAAGNLPAGAKLTLLSPVAGINATLTVGAAGLTGGADVEQLDALLDRVQNRLRNPPMGGSGSDYVTWALEAHPAVTRAWVYPQEQGPGTVVIRLVTDNEVSIIPTTPVLDAVAAYIEQVRNVTADVYVVAPVAVPLDFEIHLDPDSTALRERVTSSLQDLIRREAEPGGTILRTHIAEAISVTVGENDHSLNIPAGNVTHATGEIAVMGVITWV